VAINDLLIFVFYIPTTMLLLQVTSISVPWDTAFLSVILFMCVPGLLAYATRRFALRYRSKAWLLQLSARFKPITMVALLGTLLLIFLFQGEQIVDNPLHVLLIAVPLTIQTYSIFFLAYSVFFWLRTPFEYAAPGALIATSNFFELAVAVAMALFGADSGATLVTTVGVLEEVPIMLSLVWLANRTRHWFPQPAALRVRAGKLAVESHLIPEERRIQLKALAALLQPQVSTSNNATVDTEGGAPVRASVVFVGTHNSRRSQLAEVWLRAAAVYYQLANINVSSAGIETTELSQAMAAALSQAGFFLRRSRGCLRRWCSRRKDDGNDDMQPHYHCATGWLGEQRLPDVELFSKGLNHPSLPSTDFVAVLVCNSADSACPLIFGTRARILLPYEDPKQHDGTPDASAAYEAAVDIIGREMLFLARCMAPLAG
jgi:protein-tyrosine-phosphatase